MTLARFILAAAIALAAPAAMAAETQHFPVVTPTNGGPTPPFSAAVKAGDTLYVSGTTDMDPATGKPPPDPADGARRVMDNIKRSVEAGGMTMDDLTWVQVFTSDLSYYAAFNTVYRTYFKGPMPARAFLGAGQPAGRRPLRGDGDRGEGGEVGAAFPSPEGRDRPRSGQGRDVRVRLLRLNFGPHVPTRLGCASPPSPLGRGRS